MGRKRRSFTDEYKSEVVKLIREQGRSLGRVCEELDLTESAVRRWVQRAEMEVGSGQQQGALTSAEREEFRRLRRELKVVRMERDLLKKATAFFAKESS